MRFTLFALVALCSICPAWGQGCTNTTIRGTYSLICTGFFTPPQATAQAPFSAIGILSGDYSGVYTGTSKVSIGGVIVTQVVKGTVVWTDDCAGTITYTQTINGQKAPDITVAFHVLDQGKELRGMLTDAGSAVTCNLRLMTR